MICLRLCKKKYYAPSALEFSYGGTTTGFTRGYSQKAPFGAGI